jgi:hypothetical protein
MTDPCPKAAEVGLRIMFPPESGLVIIDYYYNYVFDIIAESGLVVAVSGL